MANLRDVASAAGVSKATVSRFINGSLELPPKTADAIKAAIRDLNYQPNPHARRLSLGRTDTIGLIVPDIAAPFFGTFVAAVEEEAVNRGKVLALHATLNRRDRELSYIDLVNRGHADGLIFITNRIGDAELVGKINGAGPCVVVDEDVPGANVPKLFCDNHEGGRLAGRYLAEHGHVHVMFVGSDPDMISGARRYAGLVEGMRETVGDAARIDRHTGAYSFDTGRSAGKALVAQQSARPTAIFASSDEIVIGLLEALRGTGIMVPQDLSIIGFDDVGPLNLFAPAITAIRQPVRDLGRRALHMLLDLSTPDQDSKLPKEELLPVQLIERASVAPPIKST
ncbi:LacI family DNA-binding transcriptional regulator [Thalassorhabdomicrobium marinisediminis]|uniref:LacI family DNA-binding transcriptional regulator n=1 Tax=Thalassorhabdomicrobium marinisediminis TaxID=2170577 RepID=UPI0024927442|nr:LacI family DNA-binding transcriptional regulator [Thalassorhabdomicrobium marinisediminis]